MRKKENPTQMMERCLTGDAMGLSNGVSLKDYKNHIIPEYIKENAFESIADDDELQICYWRRYGSLRKEIISKLNLYKDGELPMGGFFPLDADMVEVIKNICIKYLDRKYWEDGHSDCKDEYDEAKNVILCCIINLIWLADYMRINDAPVEVYFYDAP